VHENLTPGAVERVDIRALDWSRDLDKYDVTYDIILGADIVYIEEVFQDLLKTLIKLSNNNTVIILSCRIRYDRDTEFLNRLRDHFEVDKLLYDDKYDVNLFRAIKRKT